MINRHEFAQEMMLRENVRKAISIIKTKRLDKRLVVLREEATLRGFVRSLLVEGQSGVADAARHDSTGINALEDLLKNSNILSVLEKGFKSLTTDADQRASYRNHILVAIQKALAPEDSRKNAGEDTELDSLEEDINIDIDRPQDDPDFIDVEEKEEVVEEPDERDSFGIGGEDKTGRNMAYTDFQAIEKVILSAFDDLDNAEDSTMFEEYLIKNLALYFDKFEAELDPTAEEPEEAAAAELDVGAEDEEMGLEGGDDLDLEDEEAAAIELQEVAKFLDIDDIIKNIL